MKPEQKAARILELLTLCGFGKLTIQEITMGEPDPGTLHVLWADECMIARTCFAPSSHINAQRIAESWNLAPDVAAALIDAHAEIERLKGEWIDATGELPERYVPVLVFGVLEYDSTPDVHEAFSNGKRWISIRSDEHPHEARKLKLLNVTHWRPMPAPPSAALDALKEIAG